jgi:hypothetical protein
MRILIPNQDPGDKTPWASFVLPAKAVHENQYGKGLWAKIPAEGTTVVTKPVLKGQDEQGKNIYLCMMIFACVNKACFIFLQAMGKAVESTVLSMVREIVFGVGFALLLPLAFGLDGVLYSMPLSDILTFVIAIFLIIKTFKFTAFRATVHGTAIRRVTTMNHLLDVFDYSVARMKSIYHFFIMISKDFLENIHMTIMK